MHLLPRDALLKTGPVDHADWNYRPLLGWIMRLRYRMIVRLLGSQRYARLLEVGYGSGVFLPELTRHAGEVHGIDIHHHNAAVTEALARHAYHAVLTAGSATAMPYADQFFDCLIAASSLEFIDDLDAACREMRRVLHPGGCLIAVTPGHSMLVDLGLKMLTGESARRDFGDRRQSVLQTLQRHFTLQEQRHTPRVGGSLLRFYTALKLGVPSSAARVPPKPAQVL